MHVWRQESHAATRKLLDAVVVLFGVKFANDIHYKLKCSQVSKARLKSAKHIGTFCSSSVWCLV